MQFGTPTKVVLRFGLPELAQSGQTALTVARAFARFQLDYTSEIGDRPSRSPITLRSSPRAEGRVLARIDSYRFVVILESSLIVIQGIINRPAAIVETRKGAHRF
jgi:hypothetical protein